MSLPPGVSQLPDSVTSAITVAMKPIATISHRPIKRRRRIVYTSTISLFFSPAYEQHAGFNARECPERIRSILRRCPESAGGAGLAFCITDEMIRDTQMLPEWEAILHRITERYEQSASVVQPAGSLHDAAARFISPIDGDLTFACPTTVVCLRALLVSTAWLLLRQQANKIQRAMLLSHPPGHHSDNETPQNFCLVNTAVCAAEFLLKRMGINRVAVLDWDVHHGNGTQKLTYERDDILFVDIHRDDFYPFTGKAAETGIGRGTGFTLNLPLPVGSGEAAYRPAMVTALARIREYCPQWIIVSCGLNAHERDAVGGMKLTSRNYREFSEMVHLLNVPTTYLLEGGNDVDVLTDCIASMVRVE